jgi:hypothetical protein
VELWLYTPIRLDNVHRDFTFTFNVINGLVAGVYVLAVSHKETMEQHRRESLHIP